MLGAPTPVKDVPDKSGIRRVEGPDPWAPAGAPPPPPTETKLWRRFVYGLEYIDELVAQITPPTPDPNDASATIPSSVRYVLQDANHNVVGLTRACDGELVRQYRYTPYGRLTHAEDGDGAPLDATGPSPLESFHLFQGLWVDPLSANPLSTGLVLYNARAREYDPGTGRFLQNDPNGQALAIANALAMNGQTRAVFASLSASTQYADGLNLYQFVGSNPNTATDPSGMFSYVEQSAVNYLRSDLMGQTGDTGVSSLQGALGVIALANDRYAQLDQVLGMQHDATDDSGVDRALTWYDRYQTARMFMFKGAMIGAGIGIGKKAFRFFSSRLRGKSLFSMLRAGMNKVRSFFGFSRPRLPWMSWDRYPKTTHNGRTYAVIGDRYYTQHAVDRMQPSGRGHAAGSTDGLGRSIAPDFVEDVIHTGTKTTVIENGVERVLYDAGDVLVVTEESAQIVVSVVRRK